MGVKKHLLWLFSVFIALLFLFSAYMPHHPDSIAQANVSGSEMNQAMSDKGISADIPAADSLGFPVSGTVEAGGDLGLTIYEQGFALVKER
ncbi:hypothetical protein MSMAT_3202 [Methanosarcina mazei TMA]|uniref:hypothetical protein n=2 Tax=Methanosarcina mazei TaxID=2209 RepID=UPI000AECC848|nr:hypothetical protein [Methanosarcina mazei]MDO5838694.1 hypothetical protein [Methanosarcina mazei]UWJ24458.1 hypothetical protein MSMAT_3202 [Methanosarcina mazei TMA]BBL65140.1 hypothetical protein MmazTMA_21170 [Methanosarcina mazei]